MIPRTFGPKIAEIEHRWVVLDAAGIPLGRLSSIAAHLLLGKHKPDFVPHMDNGDFVIVINAEKSVLTGRKEGQKVYHRHSGYPGGLKTEHASDLRKRKPTDMVEAAVWGMLPKGPLGRRLLRKLKVYAGPEHPHQAQQPAPFDLAPVI